MKSRALVAANFAPLWDRVSSALAALGLERFRARLEGASPMWLA